MTRPGTKAIVESLLDAHGHTYCSELGIKIESNTPSPLFRWLCASILFSARIGAGQAVKAARALSDDGLTTPRKMADATWEHRVKVLNRNGYARYDESTSRMLGDTAQHLLDAYGGDLRKLRQQADGDAKAMRTALKQFKGLGDVGVDIFFREIQPVWSELYPFADKKSLSAAQKLGLPADADGLSHQVSRGDFSRLLTALVRTSLEHDFDAVLDNAA